MPATYDQARDLIRSPQFQAQDPETQLDTYTTFIRETDGPELLAQEGATDLSLRRDASQIIEHHSPGFLEKAAQFVPIVGPTAATFYDPRNARPLAKWATTAMFGDEGMADQWKRAGVTALHEAVETVGLGALGLGAAKYLAPYLPLLKGLTGKAASLGAKAVGEATEEAFTAAARVGRQAMVAKHALAGGIEMGLYTLGRNVEEVGLTDRELEPLSDLLVGPAQGGLLGMAMVGGLSAGLSKVLGPPTRNFTKSLAKVGDLSHRDATELLKRSANHLATPAEFELLKGAIREAPESLDSPLVLQMLRSQQDHFKPKLLTPPEPPLGAPVQPLKLVFETMRGRTTVLDPSEKDLLDLERGMWDGTHRVVTVDGGDFSTASGMVRRFLDLDEEIRRAGVDREGGMIRADLATDPTLRSPRPPGSAAGGPGLPQETALYSELVEGTGRPVPPPTGRAPTDVLESASEALGPLPRGPFVRGPTATQVMDDLFDMRTAYTAPPKTPAQMNVDVATSGLIDNVLREVIADAMQLRGALKSVGRMPSPPRAGFADIAAAAGREAEPGSLGAAMARTVGRMFEPPTPRPEAPTIPATEFASRAERGAAARLGRAQEQFTGRPPIPENLRRGTVEPLPGAVPTEEITGEVPGELRRFEEVVPRRRRGSRPVPASGEQPGGFAASVAPGEVSLPTDEAQRGADVVPKAKQGRAPRTPRQPAPRYQRGQTVQTGKGPGTVVQSDPARTVVAHSDGSTTRLTEKVTGDVSGPSSVSTPPDAVSYEQLDNITNSRQLNDIYNSIPVKDRPKYPEYVTKLEGKIEGGEGQIPSLSVSRKHSSTGHGTQMKNGC